jgi:polyisoprenoid-binding protein YceI
MLHMNLRKNQSWLLLLTLVALLLLAACGSNAPTAAEAPVAQATEAPVEATPAATAATAADSVAAATTAPGQETVTDTAAAPAAGGVNVTGATTFVIDAAQSEARFTLTEVLMGSPTTVVGRGNGIEGSITVNFDDYSQSMVSPIRIDASQLATDNNMRNGQIRRAILQTNNPDYQYITFTPTAVDGLPEQVMVGQPFDLMITGDLTIRDTTKPTTFVASVTPESESEIHGSARATVLRADFNLEIPRVPSVADVSEDVLLEFDFVALAQ